MLVTVTLVPVAALVDEARYLCDGMPLVLSLKT
jgi:hypothetical protein